MAEPTVQELQQQLTDLNRRLREAGGLGIDLQEAFRNAGTDTKKLNEYIKQLNKQYEELVDNVDYVYRTFQDITSELKNQNLLLKIGKGAFKEFTNIAQDLNSYQKGYNDLTDKNFKKIKNGLALEKQELEFVVARLKASETERRREFERLGALEDRTSLQEKRLKELQKENELLLNAEEALKSGIPILEKELNLTKQIADTRKDLGGLAQAAGKTISQYGGSLASFLNINEATEAVEEFNKQLIQDALSTEEIKNKLLDIEKEKNELEKQGLLTDKKRLELEDKAYTIKQKAIDSTNNLNNKFRSLGVFAKELGVGFKKSLTDPVTLITFFVGKALDANKQTVELGKALGYAGGRAELYRESIAAIARGSGNIFATTENLVESFNELAQATGFVYEYSADQLLTQTKLTKQVGLQADEAAQIQRFAIVTGKSSEETYRSFVRGLTAARNQLRVGINFKAALAEASKISGQLAANLGNNPEMIAKAVVTAKAFGMTLEQVAAAGDKLLDFGGSIESELKAELLLGRQINLERARAAALAGDQVTLTEELAKNVGTAAEFTKLNRLQQNALAESVGMTSDQLAETLRKREEAIASGKSLVQVQEEEAAKALERNNIQDKFNQAILKLQDFFGNLIAGPLGTILDMLTDALSIVTLIAAPFQLIYDLTSMIGNGLGTLINSLGIVGKLIKGVASAAIIYAAYKAYANLASIPVIGIGLGAAAAAGITAAGFGLLNSKKGDDVLSEGGYGKRTLLAPEGAIKLNDKDTVIAGTDLGGGGGASIDLTPMIAAINEVRTAVDRLYNKDTSINMDGKKVGSTLVQGSYKAA
jgi:hypothetical protein